MEYIPCYQDLPSAVMVIVKEGVKFPQLCPPHQNMRVQGAQFEHDGGLITRTGNLRRLFALSHGDDPRGKQFCKDISTIVWRHWITPGCRRGCGMWVDGQLFGVPFFLQLEFIQKALLVAFTLPNLVLRRHLSQYFVGFYLHHFVTVVFCTEYSRYLVITIGLSTNR